MCVYEEFYSELITIIRYNILDKNVSLLDLTPNEKRIQISMTLIDDENVSYKFESGKLKGKFSHAIEKTGHYRICVVSKDDEIFKANNNKLNFNLIIDTDQDFDESGLHKDDAKNKDFEEIDQKVRKLSHKALEISKMQEYQIQTEDDFSQKQFDTSNKIVFMTITQIAIVLVIGIWQIISLRKIFKEKSWF